MRDEDLAVVAVAIVGAAFLLLANDAADQGRERDELVWAVMGWALIVASFAYAVIALLVRGG